jgi:hypothetical protein
MVVSSRLELLTPTVSNEGVESAEESPGNTEDP